MKREQRRVRGGLEVRSGDNGERIIRLKPITPNIVDDYGSVFMPDTFDASLTERQPTLVWAHSWQEPIGRGIDHGGEGDERWIEFRVDDHPDVPRARQAIAQVESGTLDDVSVGFSNTKRRPPTDEEEKRWPGAVEIIERAELDEVSLVLRGAVPGAKVLSLRSADGRALSVPEDVMLDVAEKVATGELTEEAGRAFLRLVADDPDPGTPPPADNTDDAAADEALAADADDALGVFLD